LKGFEEDNLVKVVVTGSAWMGKGTCSFESAIEDMLNETKNQIQITAYNISEAGISFLNLLERCLARGIKVILIVNKFTEQPLKVKKKLRSLSKFYPHFVSISFDPKENGRDLHAKVIVADRSIAFVRSPNLSWHGLVANHELGVIICGKAANNIAGLLDKLSTDPSSSIIEK
jgi:cardiolipin synthase